MAEPHSWAHGVSPCLGLVHSLSPRLVPAPGPWLARTPSLHTRSPRLFRVPSPYGWSPCLVPTPRPYSRSPDPVAGPHTQYSQLDPTPGPYPCPHTLCPSLAGTPVPAPVPIPGPQAGRALQAAPPGARGATGIGATPSLASPISGDDIHRRSVPIPGRPPQTPTRGRTSAARGNAAPPPIAPAFLLRSPCF